MKKEELKKKLEKIPQKLKEMEEEYLDIDADIKDSDARTDSIETEYKIKIKKAKNEDGKDKYKNKFERDIALTKILEQSKEYQELSKAVDELKEKKKRLEIDIKFVRRTNSNYRAIAYLMSDEGSE